MLQEALEHASHNAPQPSAAVMDVVKAFHFNQPVQGAPGLIRAGPKHSLASHVDLCVEVVQGSLSLYDRLSRGMRVPSLLRHVLSQHCRPHVA